jgi:hypothetical protein
MKRSHLLMGGAGLLAIAALVLFLKLRSRPDGAAEPAAGAPEGGVEGAQPGAGPAAARVGKPGFRPRTAAESPHIDTNKVSEHATGIDRRLAQMTAMLNATGATPCETAHNAIMAERKVAAEMGKKTIFPFVAERDEFIRLCQSLPENAQRCMVPLYTTQHREECEPLRPPNEVLTKMLISRKDETMFQQEEPKEGQPPPPDTP